MLLTTTVIFSDVCPLFELPKCKENSVVYLYTGYKIKHPMIAVGGCSDSYKMCFDLFLINQNLSFVAYFSQQLKITVIFYNFY